MSEIWLLILLVEFLSLAASNNSTDQIVQFKERTSGPIGILSVSSGSPVDHIDAISTLNRNTIRNLYFMDSLTHLHRERIPERFVHAKGTGAFGYFEVTNDVSHICKAKFLSHVGKRTPVAVRFSSVVAQSGGVDTARDTRGYAVKFYTEEGTFDIVGLNVPMFHNKDPTFFVTFIHAFKRNPASHLYSSNTMWDFLTLRPTSLNMFMITFGDGGIPDGYRYMPGFGIHTYEVENDHGEKSFVRFHFLPDGGLRHLTSEEAIRIGGQDPDYFIRDLYGAIDEGNFPKWTFAFQVLTPDDVKNAKFDPFDVTRFLPLDEYPLHTIGKLVLNRNPINYFAEVEQMAMNPANLVPGILGSPDKLFEARLFAYRDAQYYRLGANFNRIPVNCPLNSHVLTNNRDGIPPVKENEGDHPNYYPDSFNGPAPYLDKTKQLVLEIFEEDTLNFDQARDQYLYGFTEAEKERLVENILSSLNQTEKFIQEKAVKWYTIIHHELGNRILNGLRQSHAYVDWKS